LPHQGQTIPEITREVSSVLAMKFRQRAEEFKEKERQSFGLSPRGTWKLDYASYFAGQAAGLREAAKIMEREIG